MAFWSAMSEPLWAQWLSYIVHKLNKNVKEEKRWGFFPLRCFLLCFAFVFHALSIFLKQINNKNCIYSRLCYDSFIITIYLIVKLRYARYENEINFSLCVPISMTCSNRWSRESGWNYRRGEKKKRVNNANRSIIQVKWINLEFSFVFVFSQRSDGTG